MSSEPESPVILVVDDDPTNVKVAIDALEAHAYEVVIARTGESALSRAKFAHPDLILLDVQMPGLDGFETCRRLKAEPSTTEVPVIFMTVRAETGDKVAGFAAGGVDYVTKPLQLDELVARVQAHLTIRFLQRQLRTHNQNLEQRVRERTAELAAANQALEAEMQQRLLHQAEKDKLFEVVRGQAEQLRELTNWMLDAQRDRQQSLADTLRDGVERKVRAVETHLHTIRMLLSEAHTAATPKIAGYLGEAERLLAEIKDDMAAVSTDLRRPIPEADNPLVRLSAREREILQLIGEGRSTAEMVDLLYLSPSTVYTHRTHLLEKLGLSSAADLVRFALEHRSFYEPRS